MAADNADIAAIYDELADLLEIDGANPFRVRAYREAARLFGGMSHSVADMVAAGEDLSELPGIGDELAQKTRTIVETGRLPQLEELEKRIPPALIEIRHIQGLGPKRVGTLYRELDIRGLEDLERALETGAVAGLAGFGQKTQESIRAGIRRLREAERRYRLADAERVAAPLVEHLRAIRGVGTVSVAGSYRRRRETVGDLDILVTARKGAPVMDGFCGYAEVAEVVSRGDTRSTVRLRGGMQVDLRVVPKASFGAAMLYFTGSRAHNIAVRRIAVRKGLRLNEYGAFEGGERVAGRTEKEMYRRVGLPWIEPELRENQGEIEAAQKGGLPQLVRLEDIRGDLHMHTRASDGRNTLAQMVEAARERGYCYIAITEHSQGLRVANGLDEKRLRRQMEAIDRLNEELDGLTVLKAIEVDILEDGSLDLPDGVLGELDLRVCSVHQRFGLSRKKQTERILRAMDNPLFNVLGHPTGRLIDERDPCELDLERVMEGARERGCLLEVNSQPKRLDLNDAACRMAREIGVEVVISTDAHSAGGLANMIWGVGQARRGWLEKKHVANTRTLARLRRRLQR